MRDEYPARLGHIDGIVLFDFIDLAPEVHGDPNVDVLRALDMASEHERAALLIRVRNTRPPPSDSREALVARVLELRSRLACVSVAIEDSGFRGVAFRSFLSAVALLRVYDFGPASLVVHTTLDEAQTTLFDRVEVADSTRQSIRSFYDPAL